MIYFLFFLYFVSLFIFLQIVMMALYKCIIVIIIVIIIIIDYAIFDPLSCMINPRSNLNAILTRTYTFSLAWSRLHIFTVSF